MAQLTIIKLSKHFGSNVAGEVCGFSPNTAAHILKHQGGEKLAEFDDTEMRFDVASGKAVALKK